MSPGFQGRKRNVLNAGESGVNLLAERGSGTALWRRLPD